MKLELWISYFLRGGIVFCGLVIATGFAYMLAEGGVSLETYQVYEEQSFMELLHWSLLLQQKGILLVSVGLAVLVSLPVLRVFLTGILMFSSREWIMGSVSFFVFLALVVSFSLGL